MHDLAYLYLDLLDRLRPRATWCWSGSSFGGWIALEMCVRSVERIGRLVLIDALGVKFGGREERDIADIYALPADEVLRRSFCRSRRGVVPDYAQLDDAELLDRSRAIARRPRSTAGGPICTIPACVQWLHRVRVPDPGRLWGEKRRHRARPPYGEKLAAALPPEARFERDRRSAAHYPQIEQPEAVAAAIERFTRYPATNNLRHPRESGDPGPRASPWTPAFAGATRRSRKVR